jgi:hypothetical protein
MIKTRCRGIAVNDIWLGHRGAAVNLKRLLVSVSSNDNGRWTCPKPT